MLSSSVSVSYTHLDVYKRQIQAAAQKAYDASKAGYENTSTMIAIHGRAATRGEASRSLKDPGACVAMLMMEAFVKSL